MDFIVLHKPGGEPIFFARAHIRCFGDKWVSIGGVPDVEVQESIEDIARHLGLPWLERKARAK